MVLERLGNAAAGELPPVRVEPDARRRIRRALAEAGRRIAVLDDDPTGSQTVHDVGVVTVSNRARSEPSLLTTSAWADRSGWPRSSLA